MLLLNDYKVAKALDASAAGQVVVSAQVWQHLAGTGWGSSPVQGGGAGRPSPPGFRLLQWTPDAGGGPGAGCWDDDMDQSVNSTASATATAAAGAGSGGGGYPFVAVDRHGGQQHQQQQQRRWQGEDATSIAPAHGRAGVLVGGGAGGGGAMGNARGGSPLLPPLSTPDGTPRQGLSRRSSYSGVGRVSPPAAAAASPAGGEGGLGASLGVTRAASLEHTPSAVGAGGVTLGGRCAQSVPLPYSCCCCCCCYALLLNTARGYLALLLL